MVTDFRFDILRLVSHTSTLLILTLLALAITSCSSNLSDDSKFGKLAFYSSDKRTFSFTVSEEFIRSHAASKPDKAYPKMTEAEMVLLTKLLKNNNYCINESGKLSFRVNSKQEKIYDMTFSSLIEQNYNAMPVAPTTYFGVCGD